MGDAIGDWAEGVLGWQVVDADDGLVPPALELRGAGAPSPPPAGGAPVVLVVEDGTAAEVVARSAAAMAPDDVIAWPSGRDRLSALAAELLQRPRVTPATIRTLRVGGSAGGVGTTTIGLALAGLSAWAGARTFVAVRGTGLPWRSLPAAALAAPDLWSRADPVPGVPDLRGVVVSGEAATDDLEDPTVEVCVLDVGVDPDVDVLVCRPDAAGRAMLAATTAAAVVLVGDGPASTRELRGVVAGRRGVRVPWSVRVARAGYHGRVPASLPGAWLDLLRPLAPGAARVRARRSQRAPGALRAPRGRSGVS